MSFPGYPSYRDSGVEWLGEVPAHWDVCPLKRHFDVTLGKMLQNEPKSAEDVLRPYLRAANIQWGGVDPTDVKTMWFSPTEVRNLTLEDGDLLVSEGGDVGRSSIWRGELVDCYFQNSVNRVRSHGASRTDFLVYWMAAIKAQGYIDILCNKSTIAHFTAEKVAAVPIPVPPLTEQTAIAAFLDRETAKIDALVEEQRRLIELLKEKRQAVISHAVTKGLDSTIPMKDSGVEWLGQVPAHWDIVPVRWLFRFVKRQDCSQLDVLSVYRDYGVIRKSDRDDNINKTPEDLGAYQTVNVGDLVINKMKAWQGSLGVSALQGIVSPDYAVFFPLHVGSAAYFNHLFRCQLLPSVYRSISNGIRPDQWRLEPARFKELLMPLPPLAEQSQIGEYVSKATDQLSESVSVAEASIALLNERRSALISATVTGKIDVRGAAAQRAEAA